MNEFFANYGGLITSVLSGVCSIVVAIAAWLFNRLINRIDNIEVALDVHRKESTAAHAGMFTEVKLATVAVAKAEGRIDEQQKTIVTLIEKLAGVMAKLDAVFRFIDARRRATDT